MQMSPFAFSSVCGNLFRRYRRSVNLPDSIVLPQGTQFIDKNNHPWVHNWLIENGIAALIGYCARSGFCLYPAMKFRQCRLTVK